MGQGEGDEKQVSGKQDLTSKNKIFLVSMEREQRLFKVVVEF